MLCTLFQLYPFTNSCYQSGTLLSQMKQRWRSELRGGSPDPPSPGKPKHTIFLRGGGVSTGIFDHFQTIFRPFPQTIFRPFSDHQTIFGPFSDHFQTIFRPFRDHFLCWTSFFRALPISATGLDGPSQQNQASGQNIEVQAERHHKMPKCL